ncbi:hypothetical protein [Candidatus Leptofilum sp.]|uniref:hypothetical protein n=1 Tax=Candidatus Leptofilum sp. TaxID=3241576 RepID=UPI003B5A4743
MTIDIQRYDARAAERFCKVFGRFEQILHQCPTAVCHCCVHIYGRVKNLTAPLPQLL